MRLQRPQMWNGSKMLEKLITLCALAIMVFGLSGCGTGRYAESTMIASTPAFEAYDNNSEAFGYLHEEMAENNNFTPEEKADLIALEGTLKNEFAYMQDITTVAGSVPYYEYVASYNRIKRAVKRMRIILDGHIGEYPKSTRIIYAMTCNNIAFIFHSMDISIYQADEAISAQSASNMIREFTQLYTAVKPLIATAAVAL